MQNNHPEYEFPIIDKIKNLFRKTKPVQVGDIGIYQDILTISTKNIETSTLYYDVFVQIKAKAVFKELIEIEILDTFTINASNQNIQELVKSNVPKYINPSQVKWEIK